MNGNLDRALRDSLFYYSCCYHLYVQVPSLTLRQANCQYCIDYICNFVLQILFCDDFPCRVHQKMTPGIFSIAMRVFLHYGVRFLLWFAVYAYRMDYLLFRLVVAYIFGRGTGNRTLVDRLKAGYSTIELHPHYTLLVSHTRLERASSTPQT